MEVLLLTVEEAQRRILDAIPLAVEEAVPLSEAFGRVLARDLVSPIDVPPWPNSAMDGYAVRAADTAEGEYTLRLNEVIGAGQVGTVPVKPGTASGIMTGAPMPEGADTVVMIERSNGAQSGEVVLTGRSEVGEHIRPRGGDVAIGSVVLTTGQTLTPARVGMAASIGLAEVPVRRAPRVAILSTGDEVIAPGQPLGPGQIYSSNNVTLAGLVRQAGGVALDRGNAPDDLDGLVQALEEALQGADILVTTGGVSVGVYDFVKEAFGRLGVEMDFWKVRMKPGKPLAFGRLEREGRVIPCFGLPGNPVSCMVNFYQYVWPWMGLHLGKPRPYLPVVTATASESIRERPGRAKLIRVVLRSEGGQLWCASTGSQSSGVLTSMSVANGLLCRGIDEGTVEAGEQVRVQLLDPGFLERNDAGYGW